MLRSITLPTPDVAYLRARQAGGQLDVVPPRGGAPLSADESHAPGDRLRVAYLVPRTDVGGGARVLLEHGRRLAARGHHVTMVASTSPPDWTPVGGTWRAIPPGVALAAAVPDVDVVVAGYWDMLGTATVLAATPVVHFEQGDFHLYEDLAPGVEQVVSSALASTPLHMTVSGQTAEVLRARYDVRAAVLHNAVDRSVFTQSERARTSRRPYRMMCVGSDGNAFKGIDDVVTAWRVLRAGGLDVELTWVTPRPPLTPCPDVRVVVSPDQRRLAQEYRDADVYVSGSHYESFPLPPLEAMACGTPVVSTANVGVLEYARQDENALLVPVKDHQALAAATGRVLTDEELHNRLREEGLRTAVLFDWEAIIDRLEALLWNAVGRRPGHRIVGDLSKHWLIDLHGGEFDEADAVRRFERLLRHTAASEVLVPLRQPALEGHDVVRWRVVASRHKVASRSATSLTARAWLPVTSSQPLRDSCAQAALDLLIAQRPDEAVAAVLAALPAEQGEQAPLLTWLIIALLEAGRDVDAVTVLQDALARHPEHPDLYYLAVLVGGLTNCTVDRSAALAAVRVLQAGATSQEWLADPEGLLLHQATASGP